jgi:hypothetical protein
MNGHRDMEDYLDIEGYSNMEDYFTMDDLSDSDNTSESELGAHPSCTEPCAMGRDAAAVKQHMLDFGLPKVYWCAECELGFEDAISPGPCMIR